MGGFLRWATGAAVVGGLLAAPQDLVPTLWPVEEGKGDEHRVTDRPLYLAYVSSGLVAFALLAAAAFGPRAAARSRGAAFGNLGQAATYAVAAGMALIVTHHVVAIAVAARGGVVDVFVFFGLGFLLLVVGYALLAAALRRAAFMGPAWVWPLVLAAGVVLVFVPANPWHSLGLALHGLGWTAFGLLLWKRARSPALYVSAAMAPP